jgi:esterase/lipase
VAYTARRAFDNATTDHRRYGDPTYIAPSAVRLFVVDTGTGVSKPVLTDLADIRQAAWSHSGSELAFLQLQPATAVTDPVMRLRVWDARRNAVRGIPLKGDTRIAVNSGLHWSADDARIVLALRSRGRAAFLANHGYAVFHPSVNLVVGRPGDSWEKGVTAAANRLVDMGVADPDSLGVHGTSYGGDATVLLLTQTDRFKAAINIWGKVNMVSFYTDSPRLGVRNTHAPEKSQDRIGGTLWEYPERYIEHSAVLRADRITTPLPCIIGDQDPNVPASQSREIYVALRRLGKDVEWVR